MLQTKRVVVYMKSQLLAITNLSNELMVIAEVYLR